jgi:hypothetical protein
MVKKTKKKAPKNAVKFVASKACGDWESDVFIPLVENIKALRDALQRNDIILAKDVYIAEMNKALAYAELFKKYDSLVAGGSYETQTEEAQKYLDLFFTYVAKHIRNWWD